MSPPLPAAPTPQDLRALLTSGPQQEAAFISARATPRAIAESLAALANADGGLALLGVDARGVVQPEADAALLLDHLIQACSLVDPPLVLPRAHTVALEGGAVVVVETPPGLPAVYSVQSVFYTRSGAHNRPLTTPELRQLLIERGDVSIESRIVTDASLQDLDPARVDRYLNRLLLGPDDDPAATLVARGCAAVAGDGAIHPTVAGLLLFGANPQRWLPASEIVCVRYPGSVMGDEFVRQDLSGPLPEQIRQAETFVLSNLRREMRLNGLARQEISEYPAAVVREAIVNAAAHRDYAVRGEGVRILLFSDRLEIYSPGRLPGHVTLANLLDERFSRNPIIVTVLSDLGYVERLGYGIDRMIAAMRDAGQPEPEFEETAAGFRVTLRSALQPAGTPPAIAQRVQHGLPPSPSPSPFAELNERQRQALDFVETNGRVTNSDLQALAPDVSAETIRRDLADLVDRNLLIRIGSKRATYYILKQVS